MKTNKGKKKKLLALSAVLAMIAALSGTFAWFTEQDQRINRITSASAVTDGTVYVDEVFDPKPISPGGEVTKEVKVTNDGNFPVFVRLSYEEVFTYLTSKGVVTKDTTPFTTPATPAITNDIPINFNGNKYKTDASYTDVTSKTTLAGGGALPANVKVYVSGSITHNVTNNETVRSFDPQVFNEYEPGKFQKMDKKIVVTSAPVVGDPVANWTFEASDLAYHTYKGGHSYQAASWAKSALPSQLGGATDYAVLGGEGQQHGVDFNYTTGVIGTLPAAAPGTGNEIPTVATPQGDVKADKAAVSKNAIQIKYGTDIVAATGLTGDAAKDKWVYNESDGWFYYTSPVKSKTSTKDLLKSLKFANDMGVEYDLSTFDLIVKLEVVEAQKDAMKEAWKMDVDNGTSKTIADYILAQPLQ
ncbi:hypothetical protein JZO70_16800 [Enterococcus sp. 669A]|uniref:Alternate signal-mediated exported protein n=1 Tax=Candidatus Enterococcus moelleringii TaxID=2815325 RepID=A0ABS3LDX7_9ENTE|nr:TasA family protein [Enterococcus sp. 669A]MBO1307836.1 hypothetical protein [Enterococcus sp. 669A]